MVLKEDDAANTNMEEELLQSRLALCIAMSKHVDNETETRTLKEWRKFASPQSQAALESNYDFETHLRSQLKTINHFLTASLQNICTNAANGCHLYAYILKKTRGTLDFLGGGGTSVPEHNDPLLAQLSQSGHRISGHPEQRLFICVEPQPGERPSSTWRFRWFVEPFRPFHRMHFKADDDVEEAHLADDGERIDLFQTIVPSGSVYPRFPRYFEFEPGSDRALEAARNFIEEKTRNRYEDNDGSFKPSRLISFDVSKPRSHTQVKLVDRSTVPDAFVYAALSYCWGGDQKIKLTHNTYHQLSQGISFESLPLTLRDAVVVATEFDIPYLWVDALCIIQDDERDVGRELSVMAKIYENASLTISASRARSVEEGFLQPRLPFKDNASMSFCLWLRTHKKNHIESVLCFFAADLVGHQSPNIKTSEAAHEGYPRDPLISRAWCFQERALSKRLIEFGTLSTRVRVTRPGLPDALFADSWKPFDERHMIPFSSYSIPDRLAQNSPTPPLGDYNGYRVYTKVSTLPPGMEGHYIHWCSTLTFYSSLSLSFLKDRLPAFSAIASSFAPVFGGKQNYLAGIWRSTLPLGLLWSVYAEDKDRDGVTQERTAPTWSWASISATVSYTLDRDFDQSRWNFGQNFLTRGLVLDQGLEVLDCKIDLATEETVFGAVSYGELRLRGRLLPVRMSLEKSLARSTLGKATRMESALSHVRIMGDFENERGLHRRDYLHHNASFRERKLNMQIALDRSEDAFNTMVADASDELFALPIASEPSEQRETGINESMWNLKMPVCQSIFGILVLKQGDGTYVRMGWFKFMGYDMEWVLDDPRLKVEQMPELLEDQYTWMLDGEHQEFVLV